MLHKLLCPGRLSLLTFNAGRLAWAACTARHFHDRTAPPVCFSASPIAATTLAIAATLPSTHAACPGLPPFGTTGANASGSTTSAPTSCPRMFTSQLGPEEVRLSIHAMAAGPDRSSCSCSMASTAGGGSEGCKRASLVGVEPP